MRRIGDRVGLMLLVTAVLAGCHKTADTQRGGATPRQAMERFVWALDGGSAETAERFAIDNPSIRQRIEVMAHLARAAGTFIDVVTKQLGWNDLTYIHHPDRLNLMGWLPTGAPAIAGDRASAMDKKGRQYLFVRVHERWFVDPDHVLPAAGELPELTAQANALEVVVAGIQSNRYSSVAEVNKALERETAHQRGEAYVRAPGTADRAKDEGASFERRVSTDVPGMATLIANRGEIDVKGFIWRLVFGRYTTCDASQWHKVSMTDHDPLVGGFYPGSLPLVIGTQAKILGDAPAIRNWINEAAGESFVSEPFDAYIDGTPVADHSDQLKDIKLIVLMAAEKKAAVVKLNGDVCQMRDAGASQLTKAAQIRLPASVHHVRDGASQFLMVTHEALGCACDVDVARHWLRDNGFVPVNQAPAELQSRGYWRDSAKLLSSMIRLDRGALLLLERWVRPPTPGHRTCAALVDPKNGYLFLETM